MNELLVTLGSLVASLGNAKSSGALKEHVALLNTKLQLLKEHVEKLEEENTNLVRRNAELEQQAARQQASTEFVEARGALFKRLPSGGYSETPYCPICQRTLSCFRHMFPYTCANKSCNHVSDFKGNQLQDVLAGLP